MTGLATPSGRVLLLTDGARRVLRSHAFRWAIAPSMLAWIALIAFTANGLESALCLSPRANPVHGLMGAFGASLAGLDPTAVSLAWGLMLAAMMGPLLAPMITYVAARSFADRRDLAVGLFVAGYAVVWILATVVAFIPVMMLHALTLFAGLSLYAGLLGAAAAALWQLSKAKRRALNRCHGLRSLRASGPGANVDAARFGALHGWRCVRACAPTMFLAMGGAHALATMALVSAVLLGERTALRPRQSSAAILLLLAGVISIPLP